MKYESEFLAGLEEDGIVYAHFFTHPAYPGYYGIMVKERTPEYIRYWLPDSQLSDYSLEFSIEMYESSFTDYMHQRFSEHVSVKYFQNLCLIVDVSTPEDWVLGFKAWKQESIREQREKFLHLYNPVFKTQERFT